MIDRDSPVSPSRKDVLESLLYSPPRGPAVSGNPPPVSITINLVAGAVLNISIGATRDKEE
jgi:hypothetical protein